jgi:hypothetical protein
MIGRVSFPKVVQYRYADGYLYDFPPRPGSSPFKLVIHDTEAYERLARSGALYMQAHTGERSEPIDNFGNKA